MLNIFFNSQFTFWFSFLIIPLGILVFFYFKFKEPFPGILLDPIIPKSFKSKWYISKIFRFKVFIPLLIMLIAIIYHLRIVNRNNNESHRAENAKITNNFNLSHNDSLQIKGNRKYNIHSKDSSNEIIVGVFITNLYDINLYDNSFKATFWVWFKYTNKSFLTGLKNNAIDIFDSRNVTTRMNYTIPPDIKGNQYSSWCLYDVTFVKDWNVSNFPFDKHKIKIEFETAFEDARKISIVLDSANSKLDKSRATYLDWDTKYDSVKFETKINKYLSNFGDDTYSESTSQYSSFRIEIPIERSKSIFLYFKIFGGLFLAFIVCLIGLWIPVDNTSRFSLHIAGVITAITNKLNIDKIIPQHFGLTLSDYTHMIFFSGMIVIMYISILQLAQIRRTEININKEASKFHLHIGFMWSIIIFIYMFCITLTIAYTFSDLEYIEIVR